MKYIIALSDGENNKSIEFKYLQKIFNAEKINDDTMKFSDIFLKVVNIHSHKVSNNIIDDIIILPSVANKVNTDLIKEKIEILRKGILG